MFTMRVEGGEELARTLRALPARVGRKTQREALLDSGESMRRAVAAKAPREPGAPDLADNIGIAPVRKQVGSEDVGVGIGPSSRFFFYDTMQEFGTVRHGAQPFYRPGFDETAAHVISQVGERLWTALAARGIQRPSVSGGPVTGGPGGGLL